MHTIRVMVCAVLLPLLLSAGTATATDGGPAANDPGITAPAAAHPIEDAGCIACHAIDEVRIGPSFAAIAQRYERADDRTIEVLSSKIMNGGAGNWGLVPMIANPGVTPARARELLRWILGKHPVE
ncbi:MAG: hypothetical protein IT495_08275 [Gammaproteobacteria bacterium]|nr:hypothetical protein [Gammaproteobacteria bacterium]